ncbi:MAG: S6e family ribosomal protein [Candidatus Caldarchaeales archaeon]
MSAKGATPKLVLSNPSDGTAKTIQLDSRIFQLFWGKKIGDELDGSIIGLKGHKIKITGGTDRDGFPMRPDVSGPRKVRILLSGGVGFKSKEKPASKRKKRRLRRRKEGLRRRKMIRGNVISDEIAQINAILIPYKTSTKEEVKEG